MRLTSGGGSQILVLLLHMFYSVCELPLPVGADLLDDCWTYQVSGHGYAGCNGGYTRTEKMCAGKPVFHKPSARWLVPYSGDRWKIQSNDACSAGYYYVRTGHGPSEAFGAVCTKTDNSTDGRPNILFILTDDLGFNDVSWNNPMVYMPNLDKLARDGVILDRSYAHTVCSPSRGELMTGKYAHRIGLQHHIIRSLNPMYLGLKEKTLAQELKGLGYSTHMMGKWHLGACREAAWPTSRGFDSFYGPIGGYVDSWTRCASSHFKNDTAFDWYDNDAVDTSRQGVHVTDLIGQRASSIIEKADRTDPLFLFLSFLAPHVPVQSPVKYAGLYTNRTHPWRQEYLGMISHLDEAVGEVVQSLKDKGIYDNTIIVFTSDNGGDPGPSSNSPLRGAKLSVYEGGQRVPAFISGHGIKKRGYVSKERFHLTDWLPTLMTLAGSQDLNLTELDGVDQADTLTMGAPTARREVVYRIDTEAPVTFGYAALSYDNYKLILGSPGYTDGWEQDGTLGMIGSGGKIQPVTRHLKWSTVTSEKCPLTLELPYNFTLFMLASQYGATQDKAVALFDLDADPEERINLSAVMPEKVTELKERIRKQMSQEVQQHRGASYHHLARRDDAWYNRWCENI